MADNNETGTAVQAKSNKVLTGAIIVLIIVMLVAIGIAIWALFFRTPETEPDYAPQEIEQEATPVEDSGDKMDVPEGGGAVNLVYTDAVTISLSNKTAELDFTNPSRSSQDMILELTIDDVVIAKSGRIRPGYKIEHLSDVDVSQLSAGGYSGVFKLSYYDSESAEQAIVTTDIPINITVEP